VKGLFGENAEYRFLDDTFPYTDPSLQVEVKVGDQWIEILGGGMTKQSVFKKIWRPRDTTRGRSASGWSDWPIISMELPDIPIALVNRRAREETAAHGTKSSSEQIPAGRSRHFLYRAKNIRAKQLFSISCATSRGLVEEVALIDEYSNDEKSAPTKRAMRIG